MSWRVGSKTGVTLFKGEEIFGILLDPEKAAVVVSMLNLADKLSADDGPWLWALSDEELRRVVSRIILERRRKSGVEAGRGQTEGGAGGDPAEARALSVRGGVCEMGERCGGDCAPGWRCGDPGE